LGVYTDNTIVLHREKPANRDDSLSITHHFKF